MCVREEGCRPDKVVVVRNGLDLERFDALAAQPLQAPLPPGRLVAVIGNLWPVKGHRTLVEAVALLPKSLKDVRFVCAGEGPEREYLAQRIADLGLRNRVILLGHRLDVPAVLVHAQAACLCSSAEGLSNALMEAMAARLPIVATRVGGNPELGNDNGLLVPYGDARPRRRAVDAAGDARARARRWACAAASGLRRS